MRFLSVAIAAGMTMSLLVGSAIAQSAHARPIAQILEPVAGTKIYSGQHLDVRIRVAATADPITSWTVSLGSLDGSSRDIAMGDGSTDGQVVATVPSDALQPGQDYTVVLRVADTTDTSATAQTSFHFSDPQFQMIPMEPGNHLQGFIDGMSVDSTGSLIAIGGLLIGDLDIVHRLSGRWDHRTIPLASTRSQQLTRDASRFYFQGTFRTLGIGYLDVGSGDVVEVAPDAIEFFTVDAHGQRLAFEKRVRLDPAQSSVLEYFVEDSSLAAATRITDDPNAIVFTGDPTACPRNSATTPLIDAAGDRIVILSSTTFGLVPDDQTIGCRVFLYDVGSGQLHFIKAFPANVSIDFTSVSDDGQWLSFVEFHPERSQPFPALLNLNTGQVANPTAGSEQYPSFDSVVTGDGQHVLLSSQADLDPRVGNADHTMELFLYDMHTGAIEQVSETTGGIGQRPSGCDPYRPAVNQDGSVTLFAFLVFADVVCQLDGPQRSEGDGFFFERVRAVRKRPGNRPPSMPRPSAVYALAGSNLELVFTATDPDNDPISFFFQLDGSDDVPPGATVDDHHDGSATFHWPTAPAQAGHYTIRMAAFDEGGGETVAQFTIQLCNRPPPADVALGVSEAIFEAPDVPCLDADRNGDLRITAADLLS